MPFIDGAPYSPVRLIVQKIRLLLLLLSTPLHQRAASRVQHPKSCGSQQSLPPGGKERLHFVGIRPEVHVESRKYGNHHHQKMATMDKPSVFSKLLQKGYKKTITVKKNTRITGNISIVIFWIILTLNVYIDI